jgi:L-ascorbate metabolism protein UlaG (beta-lactamase superfamily)
MPVLTFYGHSAFLLEEDGKSVLIDPFITGNPRGTRAADTFDVQTILLTHAHGDHVGDTISIAKRTGATVIATYELGTWVESQGATAIPSNHGATIAFDGGTTKFVPAWHTSSYGPDFVAPGVPAGHVVRFGGKTIYFAGDTCLFLDMQLIGEEGLDLAVIPIGDHFTMGPKDAVRAVKFLNPRAVIPCHYNTFPAIQQNGEDFKRMVEEQTSAKCILLEPGQSHTVE